MIGNILLVVAIVINLASAVWSIVRTQQKLREIDVVLHECENLRAVMQEFSTRRGLTR